jgi:Tol biopolymer transport system component
MILIGILGAAMAGEISVTAPGHASNPIWSNDGKRIAFEINEYSGNISLFSANIENGHTSGVPEEISLNVGSSSFGGSSGVVTAAPVWHPKGMLFFEGSHKGGSNRIYVYSFSGSPPRQAVSESIISGDLSWPAVSPDGSKLIFVSDSTGTGDIYEMSLTNWKDKEQITSSEFSEMAPRYNKNGQVAYTRKRGAGEDVFVYKSGASSDWVGGNGDQTRPVWSGSSILFFSSERGGESWDVVVSPSPGKKKTIAKDVRLPFRSPPALSPDGKWVAYGLEHPDSSNKIWLSKVDGSKTISIKTQYEACGEPAITTVDGRVFLAYTALPTEGSDWRQLHTVDITSQLK